MQINRYVLSFFFLALVGCTADGSKYSDLSSKEILPKATASKLIIYRPDQAPGFGTSYWVEVNGVQICDIDNGHYIIQDVDAGKLAITSSKFGNVGTSRLIIDARPNEIRYVRLEAKGARYLAGILGGIPAQAVIEGVSPSSGPVELTETTKDIALQDLTGLKQETKCP